MVDAKRLAGALIEMLRPSLAAIVGKVVALEKRLETVPAGPRGADGAPGRDGANGADGKDGAPGVDGKDGAAGTPGLAGRNGLDGAPGKDGSPGASGQRGPAGEKGEPGRDGKDGRDGRDGEHGLAGRDATEIDYRDGIEVTKSYPRGTHALYRGGVIVAMRATDPVIDGNLAAAGWAVAMNGVAAETEELAEDARTVKRVTIYTTGVRFEREYETGSILDRGVWRPGAYRRGDFVTWGGSGFIAQRTTEAKPETNADWRLAIKRGRDGKDGKAGERGPQGPEGRSGPDRY